MAGDWIKMRGNLWDDPRVSKICDLTGEGEAAVIGGLYWVWATADQHSEDGIMPGLSLRQIDRKTGIDGFGDALVLIGWLADHPEGVRIVRFDEHNGASAKKRCATAKRVAKHRSSNDEVTHQALRDGAEAVTEALARERVREREDTEPIGSVNKRSRTLAVRPSEVPEQVWADFLAIRKAKRAPLTESAISGIEAQARLAGITLADALAVCCSRGWQGFDAKWMGNSALASPANRQEAIEARNRAVGDEWLRQQGAMQ